MLININNIYKIFEKNLDFKIIEKNGLTCIKVPTKEAIIFSSITGASYLNNSIYPFSLKDLNKIFSISMTYDLRNGIYNTQNFLDFLYSPLKLYFKKKFIFENSHKYIHIIEFQDEDEYLEKIKKLYNNIKNPTDYLIFRIEASKKSNGMENILEYFCCNFFKKRNMIVENQVPLKHDLGIPDFLAINNKKFQSEIYEKTNLNYGFNIFELSLIRVFKDKKLNKLNKISETKDFSIVGEAKVENLKSTIPRLEKYLSSCFFDKGISIIPGDLENTKFDSFFLNKEFIFEYKINNYDNLFDTIKKNNFNKWYLDYCKFYLIANFNSDEFFELFNYVNFNGYESFISFVKEISINEILEKILQLENYD